ncbi:hypothetical protein PT015_01015 [Candidatus Mycobacterium wuenschmannii]|uniref:PPE family protein n=1 Tax=Candidatus Mycobacterium wuenschmannii TaxID=3027808 RepID=A0ABY8VX19_9MYCO|nr:hypothetical protein [Candidatus Mycobacterium wuenschmannii]WIM88138.1 hypothetical protein PT015_01015 [Candidatus Mycobacterium wuenschmannii]
MKTAHHFSRFGIAAVGLGIGAAMASMPAATADSVGTADIGAYLPDFGALAAASAAAVSPPTLPADFSNYAISISGIPLYQSGTAFAVSSFGNVAIAHGAGTDATAYGGLFNTATVDGDGSVALIGGNGIGVGAFNTATVVGSHSSAEAAWGSGGSFNTATVTGNMSTAYAGVPNGGYPTTGSFNIATAEGYQAHAAAGLDGSSGNTADASGDLVTSVSPSAGGAAAEPSGAATGVDLLNDGAAAAASVTPATLPDDYSNFAVSISGTPLIQLGTASAQSSFGNIAIAVGAYSNSNAMSGFFNYASAMGEHSNAGVGDTGLFDYASATGTWSSAQAAWGSGNTAVANGDYAVAQAGAGDGTAIYDSNFNTATAEGSHAIALAGFDSSSGHVANAVGDGVHVYDPTGNPVGFAATESWLTELLNSFSGGSHAAADGGNWLADLFPALDGGSAAADTGNWLTDLLASFDGGSAAADGANFWTELATLF